MYTGYWSKVILVSVVALLLSSISQVSARPGRPDKRFQIHYHESLSSMRLDPTVPPPSPDAAAESPSAEPTTLSFTAFGRSFTLIIEPHDRLLNDLPEAQQARMASSFQLYRGRLAEVKGSWVRLTRQGQHWSGAFWSGEEFYMIDTADTLADALQTPSSPQHPVIYRLSDTGSTPMECGLDPAAAPVQSYRALVEELREQFVPPTLEAATRQLNVAVVADVEFSRSNGSDPTAAVMSRMNVVDGIYSEQVGVRIAVAEVRVLQNNGNLSSTDPGTLLQQFGTFASTGGVTNPGLAHLFTGRDLNGSTVGIAYLGTLCSPQYGVGVSQIISGTAGALVVAHEMGHNFGAPHDNQGGSACAGTSGTFLMNPSINGSDTLSPCSLTQIQPQVANAKCLVPVQNGPGTLVSLNLSPTSLAPGATVTATWSNIPAPTSTDWLGLYRPGAPDTSFLGRIFTNGAASGSLSGAMPASVAAGTYEVRLFSNNTYNRLATSNQFTIVVTNTSVSLSMTPTTFSPGGTGTATWSNIPAPTFGDWIGLFVSGSANTSYLGWRYTTGTANGNASITLPFGLPASTYELRLFSNGTFNRLATSNTFSITAGAVAGRGAPSLVGASSSQPKGRQGARVIGVEFK